MYNNPVHIMERLELSYTEARAKLASLWDQVIDNRQAAVIHRRGKEDIVMLPASELSWVLEAAHLFRSPANAKRLLDGIRDLGEGKGIEMTVDELREKYGLLED
jgi:antitoxin YefM